MTDDVVIRRLLESFAALSPDLTGTTPDDALSLITKRSLTTVEGTLSASITRARKGGFETVAPTDDLARQVDAIQYELGSGPCVDAALTASIFRADDLRVDQRWPEFARRTAQDAGVLSMLAFRMFFEDEDYIAALNLYSTETKAFDDAAELSGLVLATYGAMAVTSARRLERSINLERALDTNRNIGVAVGVLMGLHRVTREEAFDLLRMVSQRRHRKLAEVARDVAETGSLDIP